MFQPLALVSHFSIFTFSLANVPDIFYKDNVLSISLFRFIVTRYREGNSSRVFGICCESQSDGKVEYVVCRLTGTLDPSRTLHSGRCSGARGAESRRIIAVARICAGSRG